MIFKKLRIFDFVIFRLNFTPFFWWHFCCDALKQCIVFPLFFQSKIDQKSIPKVRKTTFVAKTHRNLIKMHSCRNFSVKKTPPGFKNVSKGRPRGHPATLQQALLGLDGWCCLGDVGLKSHSKALGRLKVLQEALRGAPGRHFDATFWKLCAIFESFLSSRFDASLDHHLEQNIQHTTFKTQGHAAHDTLADKRTQTHTSQTVRDVRGSFHRGLPLTSGANPSCLDPGTTPVCPDLPRRHEMPRDATRSRDEKRVVKNHIFFGTFVLFKNCWS